VSADYLRRSSPASVITRYCLVGEKPGADWTFNNFRSPKNWGTFCLSPGFQTLGSLFFVVFLCGDLPRKEIKWLESWPSPTVAASLDIGRTGSNNLTKSLGGPVRPRIIRGTFKDIGEKDGRIDGSQRRCHYASMPQAPLIFKPYEELRSRLSSRTMFFSIRSF
jgi:hypothetical protein